MSTGGNDCDPPENGEQHNEKLSPLKRNISDDGDGDPGSKVKKSRLLPEQTPDAGADDKKSAREQIEQTSTGVAADDRSRVAQQQTITPDTSEKPAANTMSWGYDACNGPDTWAKDFPAARGKRQSPIDLNLAAAEYDRSLGPLAISYAEEKDMEVHNTGLSFKMNISGDCTLTGGPVTGKFKLVQFHFHWGHDEKCGSEHTVEGKMFPSELHLVHYNTKYNSFNEAVAESDGLAVIGVFLRVSSTDHPGFQTLADNAGKVKCGGSDCHCGINFNPSCLLPGDTSKYWTYDGSLTTPPCCESVKWIVLKEDIAVSAAQINSMRGLCCDQGGCKPIPNNYRPPLPLGDRKLRISFPKA